MYDTTEKRNYSMSYPIVSRCEQTHVYFILDIEEASVESPNIFWDGSPYFTAHILLAFKTKPCCPSIIVVFPFHIISSIIITHFRYFSRLDYLFRWSNAV